MSTDGFYSTPQWFKVRSKVIANARMANAPCEFCGQPINWAIRKSYVVDHRLNRKQHPHLAYEPNNLSVMHGQCNTKKYHWVENEESKRQRIGLDGLPDSWR